MKKDGIKETRQDKKTEPMTIDQFNKQRFGAGDKARYRDGIYYDIAAVDFDEQLIGLLMHISGGEPGDVTWVRCENVDHLTVKTK